MINSSLQWEIDWVMENASQYNSGLTFPRRAQSLALAKAVCGNITKRYRIAELEKEIKALKEDSVPYFPGTWDCTA